jgi:DNA invertase Pin-like site-specific DNA recombinase
MTAPLQKKLRCAVYTRKSSEEGLEQAFNSLDAQREAGIAYIASQKHEGWELIKTHYDDGGYSGGSTDRPALQQLLSDIGAGKIDVIVVYKVDRLSRSLHDFAQMMTLFDKQNVSFVSVTQQFNTTTSMGRLTLNILLSFAQFEREVTGERIRDKFAASKKKGMWMGGMPPLGYSVKERQLVIEEQEAILVRKIFALYLEHHSVLQVADILDKEGHTTKYWQSSSKIWRGGKKLTPGYLNWILRNVVYVGKVKHKTETFDGQHEAIIDEQTWKQVQDSINNHHKDAKQRWSSFFLLKGKLKTYEGFTMSPSATNRRETKRNNASRKQVRYYVSRKAITQGYKTCQIKTLNADRLENLVVGQVMQFLFTQYMEAFKFLNGMEQETEKNFWFRKLLDEITIGPERMEIRINKKALEEITSQSKANPDYEPSQTDHCTQLSTEQKSQHKPEVTEADGQITLALAIVIKRLHGGRSIMTPEGKDLVLPSKPDIDPSIVQAIGRGFKWRQMMEENKETSVKTFAKRIGFGDTYIYKQLSLANLAPDILHRALSGTLPASIKLIRLYDAADFLGWDRQRAELGLK